MLDWLIASEGKFFANTFAFFLSQENPRRFFGNFSFVCHVNVDILPLPLSVSHILWMAPKILPIISTRTQKIKSKGSNSNELKEIHKWEKISTEKSNQNSLLSTLLQMVSDLRRLLPTFQVPRKMI